MSIGSSAQGDGFAGAVDDVTDRQLASAAGAFAVPGVS